MLHAKILLDSEVEPRRREPRIGVAAEVTLRPLGETAVEARLVNLSSRGFMAETRALVRPGARIWLTLPAAGRVNALVHWARDGRLGGEFAEPLDPLTVIDALGRP